MRSLNLTNFHQNLEQGKVASSIKTLTTLYRLADNALAELGSQIESENDATTAQIDFLDQKDLLLDLAAKTRCSDIYEISQKVDLLRRSYLDEKSLDDYKPSDVLIKSIWDDCEKFL